MIQTLHEQRKVCRRTVYDKAGRAVAACCLGVRFERVGISQLGDTTGNFAGPGTVASIALSTAPVQRQQIIDRSINAVLAGAIVARRCAAGSASFLSDADRDFIDSCLRQRGGIPGETARQKHLARLTREAEQLADRPAFGAAVEEVADELEDRAELSYSDVLEVICRHVVRNSA